MKMILPSILIFIFIVSPAIFSQETDLHSETKKQMVSDIKTLLMDNYIFEGVAKQCARKLELCLKKGEYETITDKEQFAKRLTRDLQKISKDKHLEVEAREVTQSAGLKESIFGYINRVRKSRQKSNYSFKKVEILDGNIGYLDFQAFSPAEMAKVKASTAMKFLSDCDALIIDMRANTGGDPGMIAHICSYFFSKPTLLNTLYFRRMNRNYESWTREVHDVTTLFEVPLFILTSSETISAAEELAYDLQSRRRATVVGEVTVGGANIASGFRLNDSFVIYIPRGQAINPITHDNWEGMGVHPDVHITSKKALDKAIEIAKTEAGKYRKKKEESYELIVQNLENQIEQTDNKFSHGYNEAEENQLIHLLQEAKSANLIDESSLTSIGYKYLHQEKYLLSIAFFKFCVAEYPESYNVYDSLGEAYMKFGNKELAVENYTKSLELNPKNNNAKEMLKRMQENRKPGPKTKK